MNKGLEFIRKNFKLAIFLIMVIFLTIFIVYAIPDETDRIHFLNVGSADAIIIESNGHYGLVDAANPSLNHSSNGWATETGNGITVTDYLKLLGVKKLDFVIGTHSHSDHIGGIPDIVEGINADGNSYITSDTTYIYKKYTWIPSEEDTNLDYRNERFYKAAVSAMESKSVNMLETSAHPDTALKKLMDGAKYIDQTDNVLDYIEFNFYDYNIKIFNLYNVSTEQENVNSLVTLVTKDDKKALLMADMEHVLGTEQKIGKYVGEVDLFKVGHHGINNTSYALLDYTKPKIAIYTKDANYDLKALPRIFFKHLNTKLYRTGEVSKALVATINSDVTIKSYDEKEAPLVSQKYTLANGPDNFYQVFDETDEKEWIYVDSNYNLTFDWAYLTSYGKKHWYYFNERGIMQTGWLSLVDGTYYLATEPADDKSYDKGSMLTGWQKLEQNGQTNWYYFAKWKDSNVPDYKEGQMVTGWHYIDDDYWTDGWYYFKQDSDEIVTLNKGAMLSGGWYVLEDDQNKGNKAGYYFESSGLYNNKKDVTAPTVKITGNTLNPSKEITLKIQTAYDCSNEGVDCIGLPKNPYSFDGGVTYQESNQYTFKENGKVDIWVRDKAGNTKKMVENITSIVSDGPIIESVTGNRDDWSKDNVILTINAKENGVGLHNTAYSFDDGESWQVSNKKTYTENTPDIKIKVRDALGNITSYKETINITKIKRVTSINIKDEILKKDYVKNKDELDLTNGTIYVNYNDNTKEIVNLNEKMVTGFDNKTLGEKNITVTYTESETGKKFTTSFKINIVAKGISNITLLNMPSKTSYVKDSEEELDLRGGSLKVVYNDGEEEVINLPNAFVKATGFNKSNLGKNKITLTYENHTVTFEVNIIEKKIASIKVTTLPTKKTYIQNFENELDLSGGKLTITYNDNTSTIISLDNEEVETQNFNNTKIGINTITVIYKNVRTTFNVEIIGKAIDHIEVTKNPNKMDYLENYENLNLEGGMLTVTYTDKTNTVISLPNEAVKYNGFNNTTVGDCPVTLTYEGKLTTLTVHIIAKSISNIAMEALPIKTVYLKNSDEIIDLSGAKLRINYNNNTKGIIDLPNDLVKVSDLDNKTVGEKTITVTYKNNNTNFKIMVIDDDLEVSKIEVITTPTKKTYIQNFENDLKLEGGILKITYKNGVTRNISLTSNDIVVTGFDNRLVGFNYLKVSYKGLETEFSVQIIPKSITSISLKVPPQKLEYIQNYENLNLTGGILQVNYNDNTSDLVSLPDSNVTALGFNNKELGSNKIILKYEGFTTNFNIQIISKSITKIDIDNLPLKKIYLQSSNEELDLTGGVLNITYNDETTSKVSLLNTKITTSGFNTTSLGEKIVKVNYENFTTSFKVTVVAKEVTKIEITKLPNKLKYLQNIESLDFEGGEVLVTFVDNTTDRMSLSNKAITKTGFDNSKLGKENIVISYEGVSSNYEVLIIDKRVVNIELIKEPLKTVYIENYEELDLEGGILKVTYHDDSTDNISLTNELVKVEGFNNKIVGKNTLTVMYEDLITSFEVEIIPKSVIKIEIIKPINKLDYLQNNDDLNLAGGILKIYYNNGTTEELKMDDERIEYEGFSNNTLGEREITVKYAGVKTTFKVRIYFDEKGNRGDNPKTGITGNLILVTSILLITVFAYWYLKKYNRLYKL